MCMGQGSTAVFLSCVEQTTAMWSITFKTPESKAAELANLLKDPKAAKVRSLETESIEFAMTDRSRQGVHTSVLARRRAL